MVTIPRVGPSGTDQVNSPLHLVLSLWESLLDLTTKFALAEQQDTAWKEPAFPSPFFGLIMIKS